MKTASLKIVVNGIAYNNGLAHKLLVFFSSNYLLEIQLVDIERLMVVQSFKAGMDIFNFGKTIRNLEQKLILLKEPKSQWRDHSRFQKKGFGRLSILISSNLIKRIYIYCLEKIFPFNKKYAWRILMGVRSAKIEGIQESLELSDIYQGETNEVLLADPFVVEQDNIYHMFFESCQRRSSKGVIKLARFDASINSLGKSEIVLEEPYHLSYPNVFKHNNDWYMIPESNAVKSIRLYKAEAFPRGWRFHATLVEGVNAADSTLFYHNNVWWIFTAIDKQDNFRDELHIYYSNELESGWVAHPMNPVKVDVTNCRSAGNILNIDGRYFRPAQCNIGFYGNGICWNEIIELSKNGFKEELRLSSNLSNGSRMGVHTYNVCNDLMVADTYIKGR